MSDQMQRLETALQDRYRVEREIGAGGMAIVYLAHDLKHDRRVAVKVLRPDLAAALGPERFLREIKIAAKLTHPHILPLYDSGETDGFLYYVMPYIEGESLRAKLEREGELPVSTAVRILREVVDALAHAHEHGVVHRDIKPDNVLISGQHALVTDFGVAKAVSEATGRQALTTAGVALGTPAYMAPEQATADPLLDHRVDIYAVGVLAYELLAGRPPFTGGTPQAILAAHVTEAPEPITKHRSAMPEALGQLVMKCLEKKAADRWQTAAELLPLLDAASTPGAGLTPTETRPIKAIPKLNTRMTGVGIGIVAAAIIGAAFLLRSTGPAPGITFGPATQVTRALGLELDPELAPDDRTLAYAAGPAGQMRIYARQLAGGGRIALTEGVPGNHRSPRFSPDASQVAYQSEGSIYTIPVFGGSPRRLATPATVGSGTGYLDNPAWSPDGSRIAYVWQELEPSLLSQRRPSTIYVESVDGGEPQAIADIIEAHSLRWSPDGSKIAYVSGASLFVFGARELGNVDPSTIGILPSSGGEPVEVVNDDFLNVSPVWTPGGDGLLFVSNRGGSRDVYQLLIDGDGRPRGAPTRVTTGLNAHTIDLSNDGTRLTYSVFTHIANIWALDVPRSGEVSLIQAEPLTSETQIVETVNVSVDGRWIVYDSNREGNQDVYKIPIDGGEPQQLTTHPSDDYGPAWSPDGSEIAFYSLRNGNRDLYLMNADGGELQQLTDDEAQDRNPAWSRYGNALAFSSDRTGRHELYLMRRDPNTGAWGTEEQLTSEGAFWAAWAPESDELVYRSNETESIRIYSVASGDSRVLVRDQDVGMPIAFAEWSADGRTVYYTAYDEDETPSVWAIPASGGSSRRVVTIDSPTQLFTRWNFAIHQSQFFFIIQQFESDVWSVELLTER